MFSASVVITTKNRKEELLKAVESAMGQQGLLEVIVIDDGSTDGTVEELQKQFNHRGHGEHGGLVCSEAGPFLDKPCGAAFSNPPTSELARDSENSSLTRSASGPASLPSTSYSLPVTTGLPVLRLIRHEVSAGYIVRRNEGARVAKGDVIFSLDDDAVFSSPFVVEQTLRDFSHPRIGAVAIPYIEPHKANREMQRAPTREDVWITASYIGTAHAVRRDVFLALGGYREHLVHQGEEGDFCIRMLAAEHEGKEILTTEDTIERLGGREMEQPKVGRKGEGVGTTESKSTEEEAGLTTDDSDKHGWGDAGPCLDKPSCAAFSKPSTSELARDSEITSLTLSASGPALARIAPGGSGIGRGNQLADSAEGAKALDPRPSIASAAPATLTSEATFGRLPRATPCAGGLDSSSPATSHSLPVTAPEAPGFFVRLGNSDPIIHNESPKRDYSRMDFYGRRNDVLFHWQNTPMPDLLWQLPMTIAGGLVCAAKVGRCRKMLEGIGAGFLAIAGGVKRKPVSGEIAQTFKTLKQRSQIYNLIVPSSF